MIWSSVNEFQFFLTQQEDAEKALKANHMNIESAIGKDLNVLS